MTAKPLSSGTARVSIQHDMIERCKFLLSLLYISHPQDFRSASLRSSDVPMSDATWAMPPFQVPAQERRATRLSRLLRCDFDLIPSVDGGEIKSSSIRTVHRVMIIVIDIVMVYSVSTYVCVCVSIEWGKERGDQRTRRPHHTSVDPRPLPISIDPSFKPRPPLARPSARRSSP